MAQRVTAVAGPGVSRGGESRGRKQPGARAWGLVLVLAAACGRPPAPAPLASPATCRLITGTPPADSLVVGVSEPVELSHAPAPLTEAERLVFAPFYETLVRVDCAGQLLPGLAERWSRVEDDGRRWRFTLRDDARFWDGTPVTAEDVVSAWDGNAAVPGESVLALDQRTLSVTFPQADTLAPRRLADPRLAISRASPTGAAPLGTGPYAITSWTAARIEARAVDDPAHVLQFLLAPGADSRDLLDQGVDAVVTDDPAALSYARSQAAFDVLPLPWAWTYVLAGAVADAPGAAELTAQIAPEAVRGDVRPSEPPFWWTEAPRCPERDAGESPVRTGTGRRIAYAAGDPVARDIAGRLVALAAAGRAFQGAGPLAAIPRRSTFGGDWGSVVAVPRQSYRSCLDAPSGGVVPLLDARSSVVARRGRVTIDVEWDGTPRVVRP